MICRNCGKPITGGKGDYFHTVRGHPTYCNPKDMGLPDPHGTLTAYPRTLGDVMPELKEEGVSEGEFEAFREKLKRKYETYDPSA